MSEHVAKTLAARPQLVQISTAYGQPKEGGTILPRNKYTAIRTDKPSSNEEAQRPEFKVCKFTTEAIVTEGSEVGELRKICNNPTCPVDHPRQRPTRRDADSQWKAAQEKQRRKEAISNATGLRVLAAIGAAVPVRLMNRDLQFVLTKLTGLMDERRLDTLARQHGTKRSKDSESIEKLFTAYVRRVEEGTLSRLLVELTVFLASARTNAPAVLRDAAATYKVDTDAIAKKVRQEFADREKAKKSPTPATKAKKAA